MWDESGEEVREKEKRKNKKGGKEEMGWRRWNNCKEKEGRKEGTQVNREEQKNGGVEGRKGGEGEKREESDGEGEMEGGEGGNERREGGVKWEGSDDRKERRREAVKRSERVQKRLMGGEEVLCSISVFSRNLNKKKKEGVNGRS